MKSTRILLTLCASLCLFGCTTIYYEAWETLGKQKRDLLKDNIEDASEDQKDVQKEVKDALTHLKELYGLQGGKLESVYNEVKDDYEDAQEAADKLRKRIVKVEEIGNDLFVEWKSEAGQINNKAMRQDSLNKLAAAKTKFAPMLETMKQSEKSIEPVMSKLKDNVLYLKHNLNAQAMGSLQKEVNLIEKDIGKLISDMERSIQKSQDFIKAMPE